MVTALVDAAPHHSGKLFVFAQVVVLSVLIVWFGSVRFR
jgi:hypothetical protein